MNKPDDTALADYYEATESWAADRRENDDRSRRIAWIVAALAGAIALLEAIALVVLLPLRQVETVAVMVDRQTGFVQSLDLAKGQAIAPDRALIDSLLSQYVLAREGFNIGSLKEDYRKVALWSAGAARSQYIAAMQASNPRSPLATLPRESVLAAEIRSVSSIGPDTAMVRFSTSRTDPGGIAVDQGTWAAVIKYRFSSADMSAASRLVNPLGFQVLGYTRNAEIAPSLPAPTPAVPVAPPGLIMPAQPTPAAIR